MSLNIKNNLLKYNRLLNDNKVMVALSGGADSVCLLYLLLEIKDEFNIILEACHVNHMLRGEQSDADEQFVRDLCKKLDIPLHVQRIDVKALQKKHQSLEEAAREARYSYFAETGNNSIIATAHNADDNAETVLLNILRGTALKGLCGIPDVRGNIIRPLLEVTREEIITFLTEKSIPYVTDESNLSDEFTRNYLRIHVMPLLLRLNPSLLSAVTRMTDILRLDEEYLNEIAKNSYTGDTKELLNLHPAILNRIISMFLTKNNISPSNLRINGIVSILENGGKINLSKDKFAIVTKNLLKIETIPQNYRKK